MRYITMAEIWALILCMAICCLDSEGMWLPIGIIAISLGMIVLNVKRYQKTQEARIKGATLYYERLKAAVLEKMEETDYGKKSA